jgi:hypothetical protein
MSKINEYMKKILELENYLKYNEELHIEVDNIYKEFISDVSKNLIPLSEISLISNLISERVINREWGVQFWYA